MAPDTSPFPMPAHNARSETDRAPGNQLRRGFGRAPQATAWPVACVLSATAFLRSATILPN
jgi:hypothetical protein